MPNNYFKFKQFTIQQEKSAMKVGTDGVLLGAWVNIENTSQILDIGTGTGLIALMLAQRSMATIDAIDMDNDAAKQAFENFQNSLWKDRLRVVHTSFQDFSWLPLKYDLLVTNPPYFTRSLKAPDKKRSMARHDNSLNRIELLEGSKRLLNPQGRLGMILPVAEYDLFEPQLTDWGYFVYRKTFIIPNPGKKPVRILVELSFQKKTPEISEMIIEKLHRHDYSDEYINLTKDYYLKF
jgi:tRNA1Val (adenine37-N6)-methyltransferase